MCPKNVHTIMSNICASHKHLLMMTSGLVQTQTTKNDNKSNLNNIKKHFKYDRILFL